MPTLCFFAQVAVCVSMGAHLASTALQVDSTAFHVAFLRWKALCHPGHS